MLRKAILGCLVLGNIACVGSDAMYDPPGGKGFWARKSDLTTGSTTFYRVTSMFVASSKNAEVYAEANKDSNKTVPKTSVDGLLAAFENNIVPIEHVWYTTPTDVDGNHKVTLLLLDIQDGYQPGGSYIAGYFDPINHYSETSVNAANSKYHSNQAEMLYLDTYPADVTRTSFFATLAHEYQHLLQFGKYFQGLQSDIEPAWVDEGLAEVSSDLTGFGPQTGRANNFRTALLNGTSLIKEPSQFLLDNYAASYIYFRYLADVYGLGGISAIFNNSQTGIDGVNTALQGVDTSLITNCGNTAALNYPAFACSYRFMWGAMIKGNVGDQPTNAVVHYNGGTDSILAAGGAYDYALKPLSNSYTTELTNTLLNGSFGAVVGTSVPTGALQSYAPKVYKINAGGNATNLTGCTNCKMTMVVGTNYHVVFNHDASTATTHSATIADSVVSGQTEGSATLPPPQILPGPEPVSEEEALLQRKIHWHFSLSPSLREFLQP